MLNRADIMISAVARSMRIDPSELQLSDKFMEMGGDSLLALIVIEDLAQHNLVIDIANFFDDKTLGELVAHLSERVVPSLPVSSSVR